MRDEEPFVLFSQKGYTNDVGLLCYAGNVITDRGGVYLAEAVGRSSTMKEVELGGNQLSAQGKVQAHRVSNGIVNT